MRKVQLAIAASVVLVSWYAMQAVHELGHCLGAVLTGAKLDAVTIPLLGFSHTACFGGSSPLLVVWAGPLVGAGLPLALLALLRLVLPWVRQALLFFVGFCLLSNGIYLGVGGFLSAGDCGMLLEYGSPLWLLIGFGTLSTPAGLYAWHQMGPVPDWFRLAAAADLEQRRPTCASAELCPRTKRTAAKHGRFRALSVGVAILVFCIGKFLDLARFQAQKYRIWLPSPTQNHRAKMAPFRYFNGPDGTEMVPLEQARPDLFAPLEQGKTYGITGKANPASVNIDRQLSYLARVTINAHTPLPQAGVGAGTHPQ